MVGPTDPPTGASTFADPSEAPLTGHYHRLPGGTQLPEGTRLIADGSDVGGTQSPTHHTIYAVERCLSTSSSTSSTACWEYGGMKR